MSFEFNLPLNRDDLLRQTGVNHYSVEEVYPIRVLPAKLQEFQSALRSQGAESILVHFDTVFSVLKHFQSVSPELKEDAWELLVKVVARHSSQLVEVLESEATTAQDRHTHLNVVKMGVYLLCQFTETLEGEASKPTTVQATGRGRKKAQKQALAAELGDMDWEGERERAVRALLQLLQLNIQRLWDPPVAEEEFVNLVTCCCYKLLENPDVSKSRSTRDTIFQLLGVMVKKYNHALGCSLKFLQLLQHFEHLAPHLAQAVQLFATDFGVKTITSEIMREIGRMDPRDLARDTSGTRAYATFLVELAERIPGVMLPSISVVLGLLDGESYSMRNSVLGVLGEMLVRVLSKEDLDAKLKSTRDQFLDKLEDHIHDVHAFTRSKTLQIWLNIVNEKALPLPRQHQLLDLVIGRLQDKSSQVRKCAIHLMTALLRSNPFAAKLPVEELRENYEKEKAKLEEMMPNEPDVSATDVARQELEKEWSRLERTLKKALVDTREKDEDASNEEENEENNENAEGRKEVKTPEIEDDESVENVKVRLVTLVKDCKCEEAIKLYTAAKEAYPADPVLSVSVPAAENEEEEEEEEDTKKDKAIVEGIKTIFFSELLQSNILESAVQNNSEAGATPSSSQDPLVNETTKQQVLVQYLKDSMNFVSQIQRAVPIISQLLGSKNVSDVLEAINFFVTGFKFGVSNSMMGIRRMLVLVWSKEQGIKDAVVEAYKSLYLSSEGTNPRVHAAAVVNNLTALTVGATLGDLTSLEELVCEFVRSGELDSHIIQLLWERFAMKIPKTSPADSRGALLLLGMAAGAQVDIVRSNVDVLVKEGLGPRGESDLRLVRDTCSALCKLVPTGKSKPGVPAEPFRFPQNHEAFERLEHILVSSVDRLESQHWVPMAEQAVNVIFKLAEHPDAICSSIIKRVAKVVVSHGMEVADNNKAVVGGPEEQTSADQEQGEDPADSQPDPTPSTSSSGGLQCPAGIVTRLLSLAGHVALRQLVHLDVAIFGELKRRHAVQEQQSLGEDKKGKKHKAADVSASALKKAKTADAGDDEEEDMGLAGAMAEDAEAEYIRKLTETDIVTGSNLLAVLRPLLVTVCNNQVKYGDPELQAAASLALAKFMLVSSEFCEDHLQLLFTILEKSPHAVIRANTIIALGDLTFRFPNLIEPWTPNLYARLRDPSPQVRKNTMMVLTHLILNDMVKVKGQISELATCIVDDDSRITGLAKLFFHELAKKGNAIYNIMPDMVSRLSDTEVGVQEDHFRIIMRYLFSFIQKDRQCESLVEKLCHRFRATRVVRQWRDLAFCLSMLSYSDKSIRKLQENLSCFADKLADEDVYASFTTVMNGAKKFAKPETKAIVEELEQKLEQCHNKGQEDDAATEMAMKASVAATSKTPGRRGRGRGRTPATTRARRARPSGSEKDFLDEDFHPAKREGGGNKGSNKPKLSFDSDEDSDIDLFQVEQKSQTDAGTEDVKPTVSSDNAENNDPNVSFESPGLRRIKRRHKSVNNTKAARTPTSSRTTRARHKP